MPPKKKRALEATDNSEAPSTTAVEAPPAKSRKTVKGGTVKDVKLEKDGKVKSEKEVSTNAKEVKTEDGYVKVHLEDRMISNF